MSAHDWQLAGERVAGGKFTWNELLWALIYPQRRQRIRVTLSGVLLIGLALIVGMAAYNAANNILFITLSLLLACLVLSGALSWMNFRRMAWRLQIAPPLRVGQEAVVTLGVRNTKRILPTYGLWFEMVARTVEKGPAAKAESTITARGADVRAALARADQSVAREQLFLRSRLDPGNELEMDWVFRPRQRGSLRVELERVGSLFPFGFLSKSIAAGLLIEAVVWPAAVEYRRFAATATRRPTGGTRMARAGSGSDLLALRRYERGDSHSLIHWKASARVGQLLVRQLAAESAERFALWIRSDRDTWPRDEQFELMVGFAATLMEDLFRGDKLTSVAFDDGTPAAIRRVRDLEACLDQLATIAPTATIVGGAARLATQRTNLISLIPDGPRGVGAWVKGQRVAAA